MSASWYGNTVDSISATNATITNATITNDTVTNLTVTNAPTFGTNTVNVVENGTLPTQGQEMLLPFEYFNSASGAWTFTANSWQTPNGWNNGTAAGMTAGKYLMTAQITAAYGGGAWGANEYITFQIRGNNLNETIFPEITIRPYYCGGAAGVSGDLTSGNNTVTFNIVGVLTLPSADYFRVRLYYSATSGRSDHTVTMTHWGWQKFQSA